jgi:tripartite-type tricarboxylate transporter receptor subunit TctC
MLICTAMRRTIAVLATATLFTGLTETVQAQQFPSRPITVVVPFPAGGIADQAVRMAAQKVTDNAGWAVVVDNRAGGGGQIGAGAVKASQPDGHTLFLANIGTHAINQSLYSKLTYDPVRDFAPVSLLFSFPHVLVVNVDSPYKSVADLVRAAKEKPGSISFASQGIGSGGHLLAELLKSKTKIDVVHVPYRGTAQALPDLLSGRVQFFFDGIPGSGPLAAEGKLRALAVTDNNRTPMLPNVPTMAEAGYPGFELNAWFGLAAPAGTPKPIVDRLNAEFVKAMTSSELVQKLNELGVKVVAGSPDEFAAVMAHDTDLLGRVVKEAGAHVD